MQLNKFQKIIISDKFSSINIVTDTLQNVFFPNFDFKTVNENCFYITSHFNKTDFPTPTTCKGFVLGKEITSGDFSEVEKIFVYTNSFPSGVVSKNSKLEYASKKFNINKNKIYLYARLNDIYEITYETTTEFENEYQLIKADRNTINIDTYYNGDYILDLSNLSGTITIERSDSTSVNKKLKGLIIDKVNIVATPETTTRGFDKCIGLKFLYSTIATDNLFTDCENLTNVEIDTSTIGENTFKGCGFETIVLKSHTVKNNAFTGCNNLQDIYIESTNIITFDGSSTLTKFCTVHVDTGNEPLAKNYFKNCNFEISCEYLFYGGDSPVIDFSKSYDNNVILVPSLKDKPSGTLSSTGSGGNLTEKLISIDLTGITTVYYSVFKDCINLISVEASTVQNIQSNAFSGCSNLKTVNLENCTSLDEFAFSSCVSIENLNLTKCTICENNCFYGCSNMKLINLPKCTSCGTSCFVECGIIKVDFPLCITCGDGCFSKCDNLKIVNLPLCTICKSGCFSQCKSLEVANLPECITCKSGCFGVCTSLEILNLDSCETCESACFVQCNSLPAINLPACKTVGSNVFDQCNSLKEIKLTSSDLTLSGTTSGINEECKIYISSGKLSAAKSYFGNDFTYITV